MRWRSKFGRIPWLYDSLNSVYLLRMMEGAFLGSAIRIFSLQDTPLSIKIIFGFNESFHSDSLSKSCYDSFEVGNSEARDQIS